MLHHHFILFVREVGLHLCAPRFGRMGNSLFGLAVLFFQPTSFGRVLVFWGSHCGEEEDLTGTEGAWGRGEGEGGGGGQPAYRPIAQKLNTTAKAFRLSARAIEVKNQWYLGRQVDNRNKCTTTVR